MSERIYFDHNSTTPMLPEVFEAMREYCLAEYGNPSTGHAFGKAAKEGLERAREQVARALGCEPDEVFFTGGSSEANNLAVKGSAWAQRERGRHLVHSTVEHPSIRNAARWLCEEGWTATAIGVDAYGAVRAAEMIAALRPDTVLCAVMLAQNEVGTVMAVPTVAAAARERGVRVLCDASQAVGKIEVDVGALGVDICVIAAHKFYGPKGVGALYVRRGTSLVSLVHGVAHERGMRAGTENVPGIVGLGAAIEIAQRRLAANRAHLLALRARLLEGLRARIPDLRVNGHPSEVLPNTLNVCIPGLDSTALLSAVPHIAASTGAACHWGVTEPSHVLTEMGVPRELALGAIRFSLGVRNTEAEVDRVIEEVAAGVEEMRLGADAARPA
jgi:cysteine desulfurase